MSDNDYIVTKKFISPCGELRLASFRGNLCLCDWEVSRHKECADSRLKATLHAEMIAGTSETIGNAEKQLSEYFDGKRKVFDLPLLLIGTEFQKSVWKALRLIPYGKTVSYGDIARMVGRPASFRAVANAVGANPVSIFVPCHRVIGSNRTLTGYDGGLDAKRILLGLEGICLDNKNFVILHS